MSTRANALVNLHASLLLSFMKKTSYLQQYGAPVLMRIFAGALIAVALAGLSFQRNAVWHTYLSLWEDTARKTPQKSRVHNSLANSYMLLGRYAEAVREYKIAIALDKKNYEAYYNIATNYDKLGLENEAVYYYDYFCKAAPIDYPDATKIACGRAARLAGHTGVSGR